MKIVYLLIPLILSLLNVVRFDVGDKSDVNKIIYSPFLVQDLMSNSYNNDYNNQRKIEVVLHFEEAPFNFANDYGILNERERLSRLYYIEDIYNQINSKYINELNLKDYSFYYSSRYSPFIKFVYNDYVDFFNSDIHKIEEFSKSNNSLIKVQISDCSNDYEDQDTRNTADSTTPYIFSDALNDVGIDSNVNFTGEGIKIGSIERGAPNNFTNLNGTDYEILTENHLSTRHAFLTSSIYGGNSGIARDSTIYFTSVAAENMTFEQCCDDLVLAGVNIINCSVSMGNSSAEQFSYDATSAYVDYITREYDVLFVASVGNGGFTYASHNVNTISTAINAISVGSIDENKKVSEFSSSGLAAGSLSLLTAPTIVAPGGYLTDIPNVPNTWIEDGVVKKISGTSFSAPIVTGIVALLMEEFPYLKTTPHVILNALINSAVPVVDQTNLYDLSAGYGIVNYENARKILMTTRNFTVNTDSNIGDVLDTIELTLHPNETIQLCTTALFNGFVGANQNDSKTTQIEFVPFDSNGNQINMKNYRNNILANSTLFELTNPSKNSNKDILIKLVIHRKSNTTLNHEYIAISSSRTISFNATLSMTPSINSAVGPKFSWNTNVDNFFLNDNFHYVLRFYDMFNEEILVSRKINSSQNYYVLREDEWEDILSVVGSTFFARIDIVPSYSTLPVLSSAKYIFAVSDSQTLNTYSFSPEEYNFTESYNQNEITTSYADHPLINSIKRLRSGFIQNQVINLSPRKTGCGLAYLEYNVSKPVFRIDIELALWSDSEYLSNEDSVAYIQYLDDDNNWITSLDLLNDISLNTGYNNLKSYAAYFPDGATDFRIYIETAQIGIHNKGRISVGELQFYTM